MDVENVAPVAAGGKGRTVEQIYQKKTQLEHILLRPDTYIGSIERVNAPMWVFDKEKLKMVQREIAFVPGLFKIFDEIVVNAADNKQRDSTMDKLNVTIDQEKNTISVWNNGKGIPVVMHKEHQMYVPELIFGHLLTGSNFDDNEKKTTGGRNGYGAKLANIFSTEFIVETADSASGLKFRQVFSENMGTRQKPTVSKHTGSSDFTCITFSPDLKRFKMDRLDDDVCALLCKRVYDVAGCCNSYSGPRLQVSLNGQKLPVKSFQEYIQLYEGIEAPVAWEKVSDRWEIGVGPSDGQFTQVSFVNSICTSKGGQHANFIADKVIAKLGAIVKRKNKGEEVKGHFIKNHLAVYVNCLIENPAFDSQTKESLTTRPSAFGSDVTLSEKFMKAVEKSNIIDKVLSWAKYKQNEQLKRKGGGKKVKLTGITKLDDANFAGTAKAKDCTLILTEGDSAKSLAVSGLSIVGRDYYGVFPLKGKPLNVREANHTQIMNNEEIQNICKILGLRHGVEYSDTKDLRYGHLLIMADQDHDGSHIKGLLINFIHHFWPSLMTVPGFMQQFITPIVRVTKGKQAKNFFTIPEYHEWKEGHADGRGWTIKYYKGLGTSSAKDAKEYFADLDTHRIDFEAVTDMAAQTDVVDMAFSKKRVQDRKDWLTAFKPGTFIDYGVDLMSYNDFVNRELVLFSMADNERSIPSLMDGFKPSQRKVLFACFKRKLKAEIKVAQLAGYVSEHSCYHHGEMSLTGTIVGMAQDFVGANNVNLLFPSGQFGTRLQGGKDAASARYIFTRLEQITRTIFHPEDDQLLTYLDDDGQSIEPKHYSPVIPMVLVNGSDGIGTGWSTFIPNFNPADIIAALRAKLQGEAYAEPQPWFRGFGGSIEHKGGKDSTYVVKGSYEEIDENTIEITELPVRVWTQTYKQFLETLLPGAPDSKEAGVIKDFRENHTDRKVSFTVVFPEGALAALAAAPGGIMKKLKLETTFTTSNMILFNTEGAICKYNSASEIIDEYFGPRLELYASRKAAMVRKVEAEWAKLSNQMRFVLAVIKGELVVSNRPKKVLLEELRAKGYALDPVMREAKSGDAAEGAEAPEEDEQEEGGLSRGYDYLLGMKLWSLTMEKVADLKAQLEDKNATLVDLKATSPEQMWGRDLDVVEASLGEMDALLEANAVDEEKTRKAAQRKGPKAKAPKKKASMSDDDDDDDDDGFSDDDDEDFEEKPKKAPAKQKSAAAKPAAAAAAKPAPAAAAKPAAAATAKPAPTAAAKPAAAAAAKPVAAKPAAAAAAKPAETSKPAAKKATEAAELESDEEILSLSDRMKIHMQVSPPSKHAAKKSIKSEDDDLFDDDEDEDDDYDDDDDDDDDDFGSKKPAKKSAPKAASKPAPKAAAPKQKKKPVIESDDDGDADEAPKGKKRAPKGRPESNAAFSPGAPSPDTKKAKTKVTKPAAAKAAPALKPAAKPAAVAKASKPAAKPAAKPKKKKQMSDDDESDSDVEEVEVKPRTPKPVRARKVISYVVDSDESEDEFDDEEDEEEDPGSEFEE